MSGWTGVDLDGTLAHYDEWVGIDHIGEPIPRMVERVKRWIEAGRDVRIFTARVCSSRPTEERVAATKAIGEWTEAHIGVRLPVTAEKDMHMIELWDDRCVQVETNTGFVVAMDCCE